MDEHPSANGFPVPAPDPSGSGTLPPPARGMHVGASRGVHWWTEGWRLFVASPWIWILIAVLYFALMAGLAFIPFIGQIASTLLLPILGGGVLMGARAQDRGEDLGVAHLFACFQHRAGPLVILALIYFAGWFVIWLLGAAMLIGVAGFGALGAILSGDPAQVGAAALAAFGLAAMVVLLLAALLAVPLLMAWWFAPALVIFRNDEPIAAMKASFFASLDNVGAFLVYSLVGLALAVLASIPFGLGWLVLAPVYGASSYASYVDVFGKPE
jgi:uncharacterized membrane protein